MPAYTLGGTPNDVEFTTTRTLRTLLVLLLAMLAALTAQVASAAPPTPTALERAYQTAAQVVAAQAQAASRADDYATAVAARIADLRQRGYDTTPLDRAVNTATGLLTSAKREIAAAQTVLVTHAGFDAAGKVTDPTAAAATIATLKRHIQATNRLAVQAITVLHQALLAFRAASDLRLPTPTPPHLPALPYPLAAHAAATL